MDKFIHKVGVGPNIIFLHGWMQTADSWSSTIEYLKNDFTCWSLDLPGFGSNPKPKSAWTPLEYAKWVREIIEENKIDSPTVVGHSFGGRIAIILANIEHSILNIVLEGTPGIRPPIKLKNKIATALIKAVNKTGLPKESLPFYQQAAHKIQSDDYKQSGGLKDIFLATINYSLITDLSHIKQPTLIICGNNDKEVPVSISNAMHKLIKGSIIKVIPNANHFTHLENPALVSGYIRNFINGNNS